MRRVERGIAWTHRRQRDGREGAARRAARPHDRVGAGARRRRRKLFAARGAAAAVARRLGAGAERAGSRQQAAGPGAGRRRDRLLDEELRHARSRSDRRRADDVRAGQQRALPAQDLQRRLRDRRRKARKIAVQADQAEHRGEPGRRALGLQRQRRRHRRPQAAARFLPDRARRASTATRPSSSTS